MRETESSLQQFGEFLLKRQLVRRFCDDLERHGGTEDWQVRQAEQALGIYFVNFLDRTDCAPAPNKSRRG